MLFQQGETAFGKPINDGQHPHDFIMELAALYDLRLGSTRCFLSTLRRSAIRRWGQAPMPIAHRLQRIPWLRWDIILQDSTHIADDVVTGGLTYKLARIEFSGFHGREPDEFRWNIDSGAIDSWSTRLTVQPGQNWSTQYSFAHLTSPEELHPAEDVQRMTASVMYNRPLARGSWASTFDLGTKSRVANRAGVQRLPG